MPLVYIFLLDSERQVAKFKEFVQCLPESLSTVSEEIRPTTLINYEEITSISCRERTGIEDLKWKIRQSLDKIDDENRQKQEDKENNKNEKSKVPNSILI